MLQSQIESIKDDAYDYCESMEIFEDRSPMQRVFTQWKRDATWLIKQIVRELQLGRIGLETLPGNRLPHNRLLELAQDVCDGKLDAVLEILTDDTSDLL